MFSHGKLGYQNLTDTMMNTTKFIRNRMKEVKAPNGKIFFRILDDGYQACLPVATAMIDKDAELPFDDIDLQNVFAMEHWYVSGYVQNFHNPDTEETMPLFSDSPADSTMFHIVVKSNLTNDMAVNLVEYIQRSIQFLVDHGKGFENMHRGAVTRRLHLMRRNINEYEDVRNVHNIAVPHITDEMFETLYANETLSMPHHAERRNTCAVDQPLGRR